MSQAALNTRNREEEDESSARRNNGTRLAGIFFLLAVRHEPTREDIDALHE